MTTDRPDIPKRLAAQIRGAQDRLRLAQIGVIDCENRISEDQARLSEYEIDPSAFAARHYGKNGKNSYPVQTNIERCREKLSYYTANYDRRIARQKIAEFQLITLERSIYIQVLAMKPSTGRVPWPTQIPNLDSARVHHNEYIKQLLEESRLEREAEKI